MFKKILFIIIVIIISGLSGIIFDRYFFPYLATTRLFSKYDFLKKSAESVTVINKTEQVYMKEESSLDKIANQVSTSIVNIISYPNPDIKTVSRGASATQVKNGTGMIVTSDGLIMTYLSAINPDNSKYKIMSSDGGSYDAQLQDIDSWSNLAFLKINASNLPVVSFANSDEVKPGEKIVAIGNSLGEYQNKFSSGQISGFNSAYNLSGKALSMSDKLEGVFEADANFGQNFVGGPLVDYAGQIVGILGSIEKDGKTDFFTIPSNKARTVLDRSLGKEIENNYQLGLYYIPVTKTYSLANNLSVDKGALIYSPSGQQGLAIISGSPASRSDLKINDIIIQVNGEKVSETKSLPDLLYKHKKGEEIELRVIRDKNEMNIKVAL
jgi:serine protease Do